MKYTSFTRINTLRLYAFVYVNVGRFFFFYLERDNLNSLERHEARYQRRKALRLEKRMQRNKEYDNFNAVFTPENLLNAFYKCPLF